MSSSQSIITETNKKTVFENPKTSVESLPSKEASCCSKAQNESGKISETTEETTNKLFVPKFSDLQRKQLDEQLRNVKIIYLYQHLEKRKN